MGPDPQGALPDGAPSPSGLGGASSKWAQLRQAVGAEEVEERVPADEEVEGGDDADPELIAEAERIADEALAEARAREAEEAGLSGPDAAAGLSGSDEEVAEAEQTLIEDLARLESERNDYLGQLQRVTADFDNYRKRVIKQQTEHLERAAEGLVEKLLEVLDTFDAALTHGEGFEQVHATLVGILEKDGLERIDPVGAPFDPNEADAVAHEDADDGPTVSEVLRAGYRWKGRVLRPAMVKVRG